MVVTGDLGFTNARSQIAADTTFAAGSTVNFPDENATLRMTGATLVTPDATFLGQGLLRNGPTGELTLADGASLNQVGLINEGLLEVGNSPGVAAVDRFENMAQGIWKIEIGGFIAGSEHDLLIVGGGDALLDGTIEVELIDPGGGLFLPQVGDTFTVLTALGGVDGTFINNPVSSAGGQTFHWQVIYHPTEVTLQLASITVPEPNSLTLLAFLPAMFCWVRRFFRTGRGSVLAP